MDSILDTIKKPLGIESDYIGFDEELKLHINTVIMTLGQLGIGVTPGFSITCSEETWSQLLGDATNLEGVKSYISLKVKLLFDPPSSSFVLEAMKNQITELEWRLMVQVDPDLAEPADQGE